VAQWREERASLRLPEEIDLQSIPRDQTLSEWLGDGRLDALVSARAPSCFLAGDANVARLFPDYPAAERGYYETTGMFPIMHLIGIRRSLYEKHPWLAVNVYNAFVEAKRLCAAEQAEIGHLATTLPWPVAAYDDARRLMGDDFWSYGAAANARELDAITRYSFDQGLSERLLSPDELFAPSSHEISKV
jgi:4,5-dihydroxyphthalate decarboxylase